MGDKRTKIRQAAADLGLTVTSLNYSRPVQLLMGDVDGGWELATDMGAVSASTADGLIQELRDRFGEEK